MYLGAATTKVASAGRQFWCCHANQPQHQRLCRSAPEGVSTSHQAGLHKLDLTPARDERVCSSVLPEHRSHGPRGTMRPPVGPHLPGLAATARSGEAQTFLWLLCEASNVFSKSPQRAVNHYHGSFLSRRAKPCITSTMLHKSKILGIRHGCVIAE
jgi:hypothetical protein